MPCYNEEATLKNIVSEVKALASDNLDLDLLIVDDCSADVAISSPGRLPVIFPAKFPSWTNVGSSPLRHKAASLRRWRWTKIAQAGR